MSLHEHCDFQSILILKSPLVPVGPFDELWERHTLLPLKYDNDLGRKLTRCAYAFERHYAAIKIMVVQLSACEQACSASLPSTTMPGTRKYRIVCKTELKSSSNVVPTIICIKLQSSSLCHSIIHCIG